MAKKLSWTPRGVPSIRPPARQNRNTKTRLASEAALLRLLFRVAMGFHFRYDDWAGDHDTRLRKILSAQLSLKQGTTESLLGSSIWGPLTLVSGEVC